MRFSVAGRCVNENNLRLTARLPHGLGTEINDFTLLLTQRHLLKPIILLRRVKNVTCRAFQDGLIHESIIPGLLVVVPKNLMHPTQQQQAPRFLTLRVTPLLVRPRERQVVGQFTFMHALTWSK